MNTEKMNFAPEKSGGGVWLSIILPCYNVESYLDDCIKSLINQEGINFEEYEIICVNDGSTDHTLDKLERYSQSFSNIHIISTENSGVSSARNIGIENAAGAYVTFVDPDDAVPENLLYNIKKIISENHGVDIVIGCFKSFSEDVFYQRTDLSIDYSKYDIIEDSAELRQVSVRDFSNDLPQGSPVAQFISRKMLIERSIRFRKNLAIGEDEVFTFEIKAVAKKIVFVPSICYFYRLRKNSVMRSSDSSALAKKRHVSNKNKALIYQEKCATDPLAVPRYTAAINQTCFMLLFIHDVKYVRKARKELIMLGFYPPINISDSCLQSKPKSIKLRILDILKRMLKYPRLFWILWFVYGFRRR